MVVCNSLGAFVRQHIKQDGNRMLCLELVFGHQLALLRRFCPVSGIPATPRRGCVFLLNVSQRHGIPANPWTSARSFPANWRDADFQLISLVQRGPTRPSSVAFQLTEKPRRGQAALRNTSRTLRLAMTTMIWRAKFPKSKTVSLLNKISYF